MMTARPISENTRREIEIRAYHIWEREGRPQGRQHDHWLMAETEILGITPGKKAARTSPGGKANTAVSTARTASEATAAVNAKSHKTAPKAAPAEKAKSGKSKKTTKPKPGKSA